MKILAVVLIILYSLIFFNMSTNSENPKNIIMSMKVKELRSRLNVFSFNNTDEDTVTFYNDLYATISSLADMIPEKSKASVVYELFGAPDEVCKGLDEKCNECPSLMPGIQLLSPNSQSARTDDVIYLKYFFLSDGTSFFFFKVNTNSLEETIDSWGWKSLILEKDLVVLKNTSTAYLALKNEKGHWDEGEYSEKLDGFTGVKRKSMEQLRLILGRPGVEAETIFEYMGDPDGYTNDLDFPYQTPGFAPEPAEGISKGGSEYNFMFFKWRGTFSFLYFKIRMSDGQITNSGWKQVEV